MTCRRRDPRHGDLSGAGLAPGRGSTSGGKTLSRRRDWDDAHLINAALDIHGDDPALGYRFIAHEVPAKGMNASENRVSRLCSSQRIWLVFAKKRGLNRKAGPPVHDDLVQRCFTAKQPNELWLTDSVASLLPSRAPHRRRHALPVRDQGPALGPDRGLLDRLLR